MKVSQPIDEGNGHHGREYCRLLEEGQLLVLPHLPFALSDVERAFLLAQQLAGHQKNIAYQPQQDRVTGFIERHPGDAETLRVIMRAYSQRVTHFLATLLPPYARAWTVDYASFRPQEEEGRRLPRRARNDLLHTDAFPSRPTNGDRILRVFSNINPSAARRWVTTETFDVLVRRFAGSSALPLPAPKRLRRWIVRAARAMSLPVVQRSPYDEFMLRFHNFLKANSEFQASCRKQLWEFPPNSTWIVFTDLVPHAALSGCYALEHTYIVSRQSLVLPETAPVSILENLCGTGLTEA
jgi:hypothetical protein